MTNTTKKTTTKKSNMTAEDKKIIERQNEQIEALKKMIEQMQTSQTQPKEALTPNIVDDEVVFISLCNGPLILSTEGYGQGEIYEFSSFGEEKTVDRQDAKKLIRKNNKFFKEGKVYIADDNLIQSERLTKVYDKIVDKDTFDDIFGSDIDKFISVFDNMPKGQQDTVIEMLGQKASEGKRVDMNMIYHIKEVRNIDVTQEVDFFKKIKENK